MQSEFWRQAMAAEERHVEVPFAVAVAAGAAPPQILHGVIDLAFRTADGWHLIDYKTDQAPPAALPAMHGAQAAAYATHWASLAGAPVAGLGLYAVRSQQFLALPSPAPSRSR